jgi:penicillin-binding protein 1A
VLKSMDRPLAGKTGTTNEEKDAWFIGYSPDLVVGVFVGYDTPTPMGKFQTGGKVAAPIFGAFMQQALADTPPTPFRIPPGIKLVRVNLRTGLRASADDPNSIMEAFKPGEEPDDAYSVIGFTGSADEGAPPPVDDPYAEAPPRRTPTFGAGRGGLW